MSLHKCQRCERKLCLGGESLCPWCLGTAAQKPARSPVAPLQERPPTKKEIFEGLVTVLESEGRRRDSKTLATIKEGATFHGGVKKIEKYESRWAGGR